MADEAAPITGVKIIEDTAVETDTPGKKGTGTDTPGEERTIQGLAPTADNVTAIERLIAKVRKI